MNQNTKKVKENKSNFDILSFLYNQSLFLKKSESILLFHEDLVIKYNLSPK